MKTESIHKKSKGINIDPKKYELIKKALLDVIPTDKGITFDDLVERIGKKMPKELFPRPNSVGWHAKAVQLDLEKKGVIERIAGLKPLQLRKKR